MDLLRQLRAARPRDYAFLEEQDFADLSTSAFIGISRVGRIPRALPNV